MEDIHREPTRFEKRAGSLGQWHRAHLNRMQNSNLLSDTALAWRQRFFTSLAIGNGAGLAASWSALGRSSLTATQPEILEAAIHLFAAGAVTASLIPAAIWISHAHPETPKGLAEFHWTDDQHRGISAILSSHPLRTIQAASIYWLMDRVKLGLAAIAGTTFFAGLWQLRLTLSA